MRIEFTEPKDVTDFVSQEQIRLVNLCHIPEDGHLKTLSFAVGSDEQRLEETLEFGERVDGSSLFSYIDPHESDIYVIPKLDTAFLSPFSNSPTLNFLSRYLDVNGNPLNVAPESILQRAEEKLRFSAGIQLKALAELEFYIMGKINDESCFQSPFDKNYQESEPFSLFGKVREQILEILSNIGIVTKYGHSEVGRFVDKSSTILEQHEIELAPTSLARAAEAVAIAKWVIRNVCAKLGFSASFSPKIALDHAGNGMHIHLCGIKNDLNIVSMPDGRLSREAECMIGGILKFAPSLAAFGNTTPVSYLRFLAKKESPLSICWGTRNRMALIRIPLWWNFKRAQELESSCRRTFEYRASDSSANPYLLLAGLTLAIEHGLKNSEESLRIAQELHVEGKKGKHSLKRLPLSCNESASNLRRDRKHYEADNVFPQSVIDESIRKLRAFKDADLPKKLKDEPAKVEKLMQSFIHCG